MKLILANRSWGMGRQAGRRYYLHVEEVGLFDHIRGTVYHRYDMLIPCRVPGYKWLTGFLSKRLGADHRAAGFFPEGEHEVRWRDRLYSWSVNQDLRCHSLNYAKRKRLLTMEITEEQFNAIKRDAAY